MTAAILAEIQAFGVSITSPAAERLKLVADSGDVPPAAVDLARTHKVALLALFRTSNNLPFPNSMIYCNHNWQDTTEGDGMTRRYCRTCVKFAGFVLPDGTVTDIPPRVTA